jgi:hypothetical protein
MGEGFQLRTPTLAIQNTDGKAVSVIVPAGAILETIRETGSLTTCAWKGGEVQMFSFDLEERGMPMRSVGEVLRRAPRRSADVGRSRRRPTPARLA